jgi:hypothetical protein
LRIFPRTGVDEKLKGDKWKGALLTDNEDELIGKDCSLDWRHGPEAAARQAYA